MNKREAAIQKKAAEMVSQKNEIRQAAIERDLSERINEALWGIVEEIKKNRRGYGKISPEKEEKVLNDILFLISFIFIASLAIMGLLLAVKEFKLSLLGFILGLIPFLTSLITVIIIYEKKTSN